MKNIPVLVDKYGKQVWSNEEMDFLRKSECLCLNCNLMKTCAIAAQGLTLCRTQNIAFMVTRCPSWQVIIK